LFFIKKIKKLINYKLDLFKNIKIFLIFYILLLKSADLIIFLFVEKKTVQNRENSKIEKSKIFY